MSRMGSTCSMQRQRYAESQGERRGRMPSGRTGGTYVSGRRSSLRHSVVCAIPDGSIASLYPVEDNYINNVNGTRSPKSLAELSCDALCRSLPCLNGALPPGLPQDVVDDVVHSLQRHSALNATTLRVLRNCELGTLSLAGCRGVTDEWLEPLSTRRSHSPPHMYPLEQGPDADKMDLDEKPRDVFYGTFDSHYFPEESSACSTSSFVSAQAAEDYPMSDGATQSSSPVPEAMVECDLNVKSPVADHYTPPSVTNNLTLLDVRGSQRLSDRGLLQLTHLHNLEVCRLDNCHSVTGRGLLALARSHRLHTLSMANCRRLTDEAVLNISHLLSLENLSLDGCRCLTDRSLAAISNLYNLRKLDLSQCDLITDVGLEQLEPLDCLEELSLGWCRQITDQGIRHLVQHPGRATTLRILRLARCPITDEGVSTLARLSALEELDLNGCSSIGSSELGNTLQRLPHLAVLDISYCPGILRSSWQGKINALKTLELCYSSVRDSHLSNFTNLYSLEELNLDSCPVGDSAIGHLADNDVVPNLRSLDLADTNLTDLGMAKIAKFKKLTRLSLFYCNITNGGLRHIAQLTELEVLNLDSREISDDGLCHLRKLKKLKSLDVFSGRVTDTGCGHIATIQSLESLELCGGGVGDLGCTLLASLENLTCLNLSQNERITNRGAAALATLTNLKALNLSNTRVNSSALRFFSGLLKLQSLALYGCRGVEDQKILGNLQNGLPNLKCLRLNTTDEEDGMVVAEDTSDSETESFDGMLMQDLPPPRDMEDDTSLYSDSD